MEADFRTSYLVIRDIDVARPRFQILFSRDIVSCYRALEIPILHLEKQYLSGTNLQFTH